MHATTTRRARIVRSLALATALTATGATLQISSAGPAAAAPVVQVVNRDADGTRGIYLRNGTSMDNVTRTAANYVTYGVSVDLQCGTWGAAVGPNANRRWHLVRVTNGANAGRTGWIADRYVTTSNKANQATPGEAECGASPAPAPAATNGTRAAAWAQARVGSTAYNQKCLKFVREAWASTGVDLRAAVRVPWGTETLPADVWGKFRTGTSGTGRPPRAGALLFYAGVNGNRASSHVSIYTGSDVISTDSYVGSRVHREAFGQHGRYLGWWYPN